VVWPSAKTVYALRACAVLATTYPDQRLKAAEIARASRAPLRFLSKILSELRDAGILSAKRGYYGGYVFTRDPHEISVAELMLAIAGYELFAPLSPEGLQPGFALVDELRRALAEVARKRLDATSIAELVSTG
jgi:Rrf2 family cysteine metabolism transcriptional repressor